MKRILALLLIALLVCPTGGFAARNPVIGSNEKVGSGTVTQANMRISAVDGTAFVDFTAADVLTTKLGNYLRLCSVTSGTCLDGYIKAAGTGETTGAAKNVVGITKANPGVVSITAGHGYADGMLTYFSGLTEMTSLNTKYRTLTGNSGDTFQLGNLSAETAAETTGGSCIEQVLTPSATGATITSTKGGSTYNWTAKNATFNYNDAAGYTYEIYKVKSYPVVATADFTQANARLDLTATNAFAWLEGVDLSAYQAGGRHILKVCSKSNGACAFGYVSATAPAGAPDLDSELYLTPDFATDTNWTKGTGWTIAGTAVKASHETGVNLFQSPTCVVNGLYKGSIDVVAISSTMLMRFNTQVTDIIAASSATGTRTGYAIATIASQAVLYRASASTDTAILDDASLKRVLDPPSTAVRIVSTQNGATRAWTRQDADYLPNDSTGQTYSMIYVGD